ncbi:protein-glutamine gamma-glutamyltransferase [Pontibacillus yanchengensis]|uniref:Protein-glutamine gamma-glutamyltransferase n=1 Tax=Pontibacillus yanchengensis Y32 TaxID=1385514 RepID=A0A0A2TYW8_9BACI|nr:protein-glutamine gamma-glutamyltransferase [Pontibacillus yanchengensis]KGP74460.1 protein-glutamine gamma-glutamyltransferase [Pontibacillus yanchengensis Y32]
MLQVSGSPFQISESLNVGNKGEQILQKMQNVSASYAYPSLQTLMFDINFRKNMMESAIEMNESGVTFEGFSESTCNPAYWILTSAGGFMMKPYVLPSDAIQDIFENGSLYAFECATASVINFYHALLNSIGASMFNAYFPNLYLYSWHTDPDLGLYTFYANHYLPGDVVYFNNPDFSQENSGYRGENAIALTGGKFFGHGFGIGTAEEIIEFLNEKRYPRSTRSAYLTRSLSRLSQESIERFAYQRRDYKAQKILPFVIHHNRISISSSHYLRYLLKVTRGM